MEAASNLGSTHSRMEAGRLLPLTRATDVPARGYAAAITPVDRLFATPLRIWRDLRAGTVPLYT